MHIALCLCADYAVRTEAAELLKVSVRTVRNLLRRLEKRRNLSFPEPHLSRWRWLAFQRSQFPARKDCGDDAKGSFAAFIHFLSIGVLRKDLRQRRGTTVYYFFFHSSQDSLTVPGPYPA